MLEWLLAGSILSSFLFKNKVRGGVSKAISTMIVRWIYLSAVTSLLRLWLSSNASSLLLMESWIHHRLQYMVTQPCLMLLFFPDHRLTLGPSISRPRAILPLVDGCPSTAPDLVSVGQSINYPERWTLKLLTLSGTVHSIGLWVGQIPWDQCQVCHCLLFMQSSG